MEAFLAVILEAAWDTLRMLPFLFGAYLLMEWLEHRSGERMEGILARARRLGPVTGALRGCLPQCGFSVAAAQLYAGRVITMGTLAAVFLSTSDEAVPLLLGDPRRASALVPLLGMKIVVGVLVGMLIDRMLPAQTQAQGIHDLCGRCGCEEGRILPAALRHTGGIALFILAVNLLLGSGTALLGEQRLADLLLSGNLLQPMISALVGLIPNCAGSVLLTRLYLSGAVSFGSMTAGLLSASGVGLMVLLRQNPRPKENLTMLGILWSVGTVIGLGLQLAL